MIVVHYEEIRPALEAAGILPDRPGDVLDRYFRRGGGGEGCFALVCSDVEVVGIAAHVGDPHSDLWPPGPRNQRGRTLVTYYWPDFRLVGAPQLTRVAQPA